jgi:hypothetical protein
MNRPQAEKLLGGFAAGILTEAEKTALFTAALEHQALFDALADEEALRQLLADPAARAELLAVFPRPAVRLWRRPAFVGLAAGLFLLVTTSMVLLRRGEPSRLHTLPPVQAVPEAAKAEAFAPSAAEPVPPPAPRPKSAPARAKGVGSRTLPEAPGGALPAAESAQAEGKAKTAASDQAMAPKAAAELEQPQAAPASLARAAKGAAPPSPAPVSPEPQPLSTLLEPLPDGRTSLRVSWGPGGHLYVLLRTPAGVRVLQALRTARGPDGRSTSTFETPLAAQDKLDVYVLPQPAGDPAAIPEAGPADGRHQRVHPR